MPKTLSLLFILFAYNIATAQNMVHNPGFEQYSTCPDYLDQVVKCIDWKKPTAGSPDYYNSCDILHVDVPLNINGYQDAAAGSAYAGLLTRDGNDPEYREYLKGRLNTLQVGYTYRVSIQVSRAGGNRLASDGLAILFTCDSTYIDSANNNWLPFVPQIDYTSYGIITDSTNWLTLTDTFVADSAYRHLFIGCFKPDSLLMLDTMDAGQEYAYYYIDNVLVESIASAHVGNMPAGIQANVYPNPFSSFTIISFNNPQQLPYTFSLYNVKGQKAMELTDIRSDNIILRRNDLAPGLYYYRLTTTEATMTYTGKVIIER